MRQRDIFEASCHEAITKLRQDIADGVYRPVADSKCVDRILKAWERSQVERARYAQRGLPVAITSPEAAAARIRDQFGDTPELQARRRTDLDTYGVRRRPA